MSDLVLTNQGDFQVLEVSTQATDQGRSIASLYDLGTTEDYIADLIIKAVKTPRGNITETVPEIDGVTLIDANYGSSLYRELSEGITLNFLSRVKSHIISTLQTANLLVNIIDVVVGMVDPYTIQLNIVYGDNTPSTFIQLSI
jgi:hypothetical protein